MASLTAGSSRLRVLGALVLSILVARAAAQNNPAGTTGCQTNANCTAAATNNAFADGTECVADPYGYCGYIGAKCDSVYQCDFGTCSNGVCRGYFGDSCSPANNGSDCLGVLPCGSDSTCGGGGGTCSGEDTRGQPIHSDFLCTMQSCLAGASASDKYTCSQVTARAVANGHGCTSDDMCTSGSCSTSGPGAWTCVASASQVATNRRRTFRSATLTRRAQAAGVALPGQSARRGRPIAAHARSLNTLCPRGLSACSAAPQSDGDYNCVDTDSSSSTCGGCSAGVDVADPLAPAGVDCSALPGVDEVECVGGRCRISASIEPWTG